MYKVLALAIWHRPTHVSSPAKDGERYRTSHRNEDGFPPSSRSATSIGTAIISTATGSGGTVTITTAITGSARASTST